VTGSAASLPGTAKSVAGPAGTSNSAKSTAKSAAGTAGAAGASASGGAEGAAATSPSGASSVSSPAAPTGASQPAAGNQRSGVDVSTPSVRKLCSPRPDAWHSGARSGRSGPFTISGGQLLLQSVTY
jgi:hypothetical protein